MMDVTPLMGKSKKKRRMPKALRKLAKITPRGRLRAKRKRLGLTKKQMRKRFKGRLSKALKKLGSKVTPRGRLRAKRKRLGLTKQEMKQRLRGRIRKGLRSLRTRKGRKKLAHLLLPGGRTAALVKKLRRRRGKVGRRSRPYRGRGAARRPAAPRAAVQRFARALSPAVAELQRRAQQQELDAADYIDTMPVDDVDTDIVDETGQGLDLAKFAVPAAIAGGAALLAFMLGRRRK